MPATVLPSPGQLISSEQVVTGAVNTDGTIASGAGLFTVAKPSTGHYTITFATPFSAVPTIIVCDRFDSGGGTAHRGVSHDNQTPATASVFQVTCTTGDAASYADRGFNFIAYIPSAARLRVPRDYGIVTALPTSPAPQTGDMCTYVDSLASPTFRFRLQYNGSSSSAYKWEVIGGTPQQAYLVTQVQCGFTSTYVTQSPILQFNLPLAGDWDIQIGCAQGFANQSTPIYQSFAAGSTGANDDWAALGYSTVVATNQTMIGPIYRFFNKVANDLIQEQFKVTNSGGLGTFRARFLRAWPVRVG